MKSTAIETRELFEFKCVDCGITQNIYAPTSHAAQLSLAKLKWGWRRIGVTGVLAPPEGDLDIGDLCSLCTHRGDPDLLADLSIYQ